MRMVSSSQFHLVQALELHGAGMLCFSPVDTDFPDVFVLIRETFTASAHAANSEKYLNEKMLLKNLFLTLHVLFEVMSLDQGHTSGYVPLGLLDAC